jgi:molybdopterin-binding protein
MAGIAAVRGHSMKLSARNQIKGRVVGVQRGATTGHVRIDIGNGVTITSSITNEAIDELGLAVGDEATAVIKASDVMVAKLGGMLPVRAVRRLAAILVLGGIFAAPAFAAAPAAPAPIVVSGPSQSIVITGRDGYRAVLAVGEIAPEFEGKRVLLAERMDGRPLGADHLRVVVPLDKRGGRSVRDVARIEVTAAPTP